MIIDKLKERNKLLKHSDLYWSPRICFLCNERILKQDMENLEFEKINKNYVHSKCIKNKEEN